MIKRAQYNALFTLIISYSCAPVAAQESVWSALQWPNPEILPLPVVVAASVVALTIGHTSALGFTYYWKKNKTIFKGLSTASLTGLGVLTYTSFVDATRDTRLNSLGLLGIATVTAAISSCIGVILTGLNPFDKNPSTGSGRTDLR